MATPSQIAANQANSKKSTGPRTEEGKSKSAVNRLSHGFASTTLTIMPGENPAEFDALLADLAREHQPATVTEQILVEKMALNQWLSLRAYRLQSEAFRNQMLAGVELGVPKQLSLLIRYHSTAERAFHKAHNELVKAQKERKMSEIGFEPQDAAAHVAAVPQTPNATPPVFEINPDFTFKSAKFAASCTIFPAAA